ncbi:MAG: DUF559 domain-containing protein [Candidatus Liptonbacteria bacterium]|nr:DUF559 domain-containing protein [Candidatus Liptonbacteria bacterium]
MLGRNKEEARVLVGVLKNRRDLDILLRERWYRIPVRHMPKRKFEYIAFYQPAAFGMSGKCIRYYSRVAERDIKKRRALLPDEAAHRQADADYVQIHVRNVRELRHPVRNILPRRVIFGFTTLDTLRKARNMLEVYGVADTETVMREALRGAGIRAVFQKHLSYGKKGARKRYCLDFAISCRRGAVAIECDNTKAHSGARQRERDRAKDTFLRQRGWTVLRFAEKDIIAKMEHCMARVRRAVRTLGGLERQ